MRVVWLDNSENRANITRRRWPWFWIKETTAVVWKLFGGESYWFYEQLQDEGLAGMVDGHYDGHTIEHHSWHMPFFSLARTLFNARASWQEQKNREYTKMNRLKHKADSRKKNPWKRIETLPQARLLESSKEST